VLGFAAAFMPVCGCIVIKTAGNVKQKQRERPILQEVRRVGYV
jgi:hypothetical protein